MIKFKFTNADTEDYRDWISFYPGRNKQSPFILEVKEYGYFDPRPQIIFNLTSVLAIILPFISGWFILLSIALLFYGWGTIHIKLPYDTGKRDDHKSSNYGCMTYSNGNFPTEFWVYWGNRRKHLYLPWALQWVRTSTLLADDTWFSEPSGVNLNYSNVNEYGSYEWLEENKWKGVHDYLDKYDGETVKATISVVEREWRPRWFKWISLFSQVNKTISIDFDKEVGKRKGSWKGGTTGCSYTMNKGETPLQTLRRMEIKREL